MRRSTFSIVPALAAMSAMFLVLPSSGADVTVRMVASDGDTFAYRPLSIRLDGAGRVAFRNDSRVTHTASCDGCPWDTGDVQPGQTVIVEIQGDEQVVYACRYHGPAGMRGTIEL